MRNRYFNILFLLLVAWPTLTGQDRIEPAAHHSDENYDCSEKEQCFQSGERITYVVYYNWGFLWVSAGEVTFSVKEDSQGYHLVCDGSSYSSYDWFFSVDNRYESFIDKESFLPFLSIRDVKEGNYQKYEEVEYDRSNHTAWTRRATTKEDPLNTTTSEIDYCVHDLLSIIYYARSSPWRGNAQVGYEIPVDLFFGKEQYDLALTYRSHEPEKRIKKLGVYDVLQFSPELIEGELFSEGDEMNIWVTNDANKLPVLIESPLSVGKVKVVLKDYEGLKYELKARVK
jgi:hypothetical protein